MKKSDQGSILVASILVLYIIMMVSAGFFMLNANENNYARRYYHSAQALWLAEAGINLYMANPAMLGPGEAADIAFAGGKVYLSQDDSRPMLHMINAIGDEGNSHREIQVAYPAGVPDALNDTLATSGNITIKGSRTFAVINGRTRLTGSVTNSTTGLSDVIFDDAQQGADSSLTSLTPISNGESTDSDVNFVNNSRSLMANYPSDQVLYLKDTDTATLTPEMVAGKTIVYVEGSSGGGNVIINTNALVAANQTLTVMATGTVTFNQSGQQAANSQLNIIAWGGYNETVNGPSTYRGLIYTHGVADFSQVRADSVTNGGVIADGGIVLNDIWSTKIFNHVDMTNAGSYPPGFEILTGASTTAMGSEPVSWKEIPL